MNPNPDRSSNRLQSRYFLSMNNDVIICGSRSLRHHSTKVVDERIENLLDPVRATRSFQAFQETSKSSPLLTHSSSTPVKYPHARVTFVLAESFRFNLSDWVFFGICLHSDSFEFFDQVQFYPLSDVEGKQQQRRQQLGRIHYASSPLLSTAR